MYYKLAISNPNLIFNYLLHHYRWFFLNHFRVIIALALLTQEQNCPDMYVI
jgi:hypothetical protein